jgi:hypothetical protein
MRKLKLEIESLEVETFPVADGGKGAGTVLAHSGFTNCGGVTCFMSLCPDCGGPTGGAD